MEVSGIVVREGSPCSSELPGSSNCGDVEMVNFHGTNESLLASTGTDLVDEEILLCETAPESVLPAMGLIEEENLHCETAEMTDATQQEDLPCENVVDLPLAEVGVVEEENFLCERVELLAANTNPAQEDIPPQELLSSSTIEESSHCEMEPQLSSRENDTMGKETSCNNLAALSIVEENDVGEEEIPLAEAVTLYCHDVDNLQYNAECQSSDPLAFDQENGDPSSIIIKDEPIDDPEEDEVLSTENIVDEMCIKIENENGHSLAFGEVASFEDKEYTQNLNLDNIYSANCSDNDDYNSFLTQNNFHSEISTSDHISKIHRKAGGFSKDISLGHQQDELVERQGNMWNPVSIMKQEDLQQNVVNRRNKNQRLNSYMVKIPQPGFHKSKIDMPGAFACEYCGKQFRSSCALRGHLSKCPQRRRSIVVSKSRGSKQNVIESKPVNISSNQEVYEDSVKPTVQLRNSFNTKKNYLHFDCDLCEKAFPTLQGFAIHSRRHAQTSMDFQCLNCPMTFRTREKVFLHCKRNGHQCKKFKCSLCSKAFFTKLSLRKHEEIHDVSEYVFSCTICNKSFETAIKLQNHQQHCQLVENNPKDLKKSSYCSCSVCGQRYKSVKRLVRHMKWHANEKYNACPVCKKKFMNKDTLKQHKAVHQAEGKFCCDLCDRVFDNVSYLRKHVFRHTGNTNTTLFTGPEGYTCDRCHKSYSTISGLYGHSAHCRGKRMKKKKFLTRNKSSVTSKFQNFQPMQNEVIILNSKIKIKIKRKDTQQVLENITLPSTQDSKSKVIKCDLCKKTYSSLRNLERHRQIHFGQMVSDTENTVLCGICGNLFSSNITLLRHQRLHKVGKQFQCLLCRKMFPASRNLKIHMHSHRTEDKELLNCDVCNKAFSSEIHLKYHRRTHAVTGAHVCSKCQRSFTTFHGLNGHRRHCPGLNFSVEHPASSTEYNINQTVFRTPPSAIKKNSNEKIMLKSSKPFQLPLNNTCNICNKKFSSQVLLKYHLRHHSSESSLTCFNCKKTFDTYRGLSGHLSHCPVRHVVMAGLQNRVDETLQCHICEKTTSNLENFMSHMRTHAKDLSFSCDICGKVLGTSQARRIHIKRFHSDGGILMAANPVKPISTVKKAISKQVTPTSLNYGFPSPSHSSRSDESVMNAQSMSDLSSPEENYKNYFIIKRSSGSEKYLCTICNKVLLSRKNLKFHYYLHSGDSRYKCDVCGAIMHSAGALKTHKSRKHSRKRSLTNEVNVKISSDGVDNIQPKNLKNYTDKMKDKNISDEVETVFIKEEAALQVSHEKSMFQCNYCPRTFGLISKLRMHEASHLRALKCSVCDGSFRTHKDFKEHVCADNFFPLLCEHCGVQFTDDFSFTSHSCGME